MDIPTEAELVNAIADAARSAITRLFGEHPESFYYCTLITTGEALAPFLCAWSREQLNKAIAAHDDPDNALRYLKWSYADTPYFAWGFDEFATVRKLFEARPAMDCEDDVQWANEYELRLRAMEVAMARLDSEGLFGQSPKRHEIVVLVEVMPPDYTNTQRAYRLNPIEALGEWLVEAAEE